MKISLIVAMDDHQGIGKDNDLMWHLPADMRFFKETTTGHIVVMGRKNYESIPEKFRPLPNRENVVLTRNTNFEAPGCLVFHDVDALLAHYKEESDRHLFIIGGGEIYNMALATQMVQEMYITHVHQTYHADTFFPSINPSEWEVSNLMEHPKDEKHEAGFTIVKYTKK